tara:strand:+ start:3155 stop:3550 length:396 start_codon:yes stop_codon:yes gene_type:complete
MRFLYKIKHIFFILLASIFLSSCSVISDDISCQFTEIDCYRFDYTSIDTFKDSVESYSYKWSLSDPSKVVSDQVLIKDLSINSFQASEALIEANPESMFVLGNYIIENQKPREWLFVAEQAFIRNFNNLGR